MNETYKRLEFDKICDLVAKHAAFSLGRKRVLESEPSFSRLTTSRDLQRVKAAMSLLIHYGSLSFGGIQDVSGPLARASKDAVLPVEEIVAVGRFMHGSFRLKSQFKNLDNVYESLIDLFESIDVDTYVMNRIDQCFSDQGEVLDRASDALRTIRKSLNAKRQELESKTQEFLSRNKDALVEPVVTLQQGRRTFLVRNGDKNKFDGTIYGHSASGQSVYFEPVSLTRIQHELNQLYANEAEEIERICREVSHDIKGVAGQLQANLNTCAIIDELFAKAEWGKRHDGCVATLSDSHLNLVKARHPLIDAKEVIANTYTLIPPYRMIIISGPNTGGKSVSLKTMGLAVLMTLCGFPVLAESAEVMFVDQIFVDIGDQQSIEKSLSSFSAHLETMKTVCEHATARSLVLLDELGSQTDPLEGEALSMAILDHFRSVGCFVVATTHFSRLKQYGTQHNEILIASVAFDMETLSPTYRYREHVMGESNALDIASRLGLNQDIVSQARVYKKESTQETDRLLEILEVRIKENDDLKVMLETERSQFEAEKVIADEELKTLRQRLINEKEQWLETKNAEFNQSLDVLLEEVSQYQKTAAKPQEKKRIIQEIEKSKSIAKVEPINVGDRVTLINTSQVGVVERIEKTTASVVVGTLSLKVDVSNLQRVAGPVKKKKPNKRAHSVSRIMPQSTECNIIGMRVAEAMPVMERFIDSCVLNRVNTFRIVHGHGSGALRNAVHDALRRNKHVGSFELAAVNEGGSGATRVVLKQ